MKKKIIFCFDFLIILCVNMFAQTSKAKFYSNSFSGYSGYATSSYMGNLNTLGYKTNEDLMNYIEKRYSDLTKITKLTKNITWLYHQAMNEWDYEKNEVFCVLCAESVTTSDAIMMVIIVDNENDFIWNAYLVDLNMEIKPLFPNS